MRIPEVSSSWGMVQYLRDVARLLPSSTFVILTVLAFIFMHVALCCKVAAALKFTFNTGNREQWQDVTLVVTDLIRVFLEAPHVEFH